ncbi:MAG: glutaredoxin 3 [Moraxellaceae bacterium]|nr:glutaredoxin 3 [Moraxellaceae bacterium]
MADIVMYTTPVCPYCVRAKHLLKQKGVTWTEVDVSRDAEARMALMARTKQRTVPQIFINDQHVGGSDDLYALERAGKLDALLAG